VAQSRRGARKVPEGTVKWFRTKGYGCIFPKDGDENPFVRYTAIEGSGFKGLEEGTRVSYVVERGRRRNRKRGTSASPDCR